MELTFRLWDIKNKQWLHGSEPDEINELFDINYFINREEYDMMLDLDIDAGKQYQIVLPDVDPASGKLIFIEPY